MSEDQEMVIAMSVEIGARELRGKLWLALKMLERGHTVFIGGEDSVKSGFDLIAPDVYFAGHARYSDARFTLYRHLDKAGIQLVFLDPEGGVFVPGEAWEEERLSEDILGTGVLYFSWGQKQAQTIRSRGLFPNGDVVVSGNPRFDLLQRGLRETYRAEAAELNDVYGEFVLVNTNFAVVNHIDADPMTVVEGTPTYTAGVIPHQERIMEHFLELLEALTYKFPDRTVVVRPHPGERHGPYREIARGIDNLEVVHEGDVRPWLLAAACTIHNGSTTGIESALMERHVFAYRPVMDVRWDAPLPNLVSDERRDLDTLLQGVESVLTGDASPYELSAHQRTALQEYLYNIEDNVSADIIVDAIGALESSKLDESELPEPDLGQRLKRLLIAGVGRRAIDGLIRTVPSRRRRYEQSKLSTLEQEDLRSECRTLDPHLSFDVDDIRIAAVSGMMNLFELRRQEKEPPWVDSSNRNIEP